jgi:transposase
MKHGLPYDIELRQRVMQTRKDNNWTQEETADFFDLGLTTIKRWCKLLKETGSLEARPRGPGQSPLIGEKGLEKIRVWVEEKPDLTIKELCKKYASVERVSTSTISRSLARLGFTFKKKRCPRVKKIEKMYRERSGSF